MAGCSFQLCGYVKNILSAYFFNFLGFNRETLEKKMVWGKYKNLRDADEGLIS